MWGAWHIPYYLFYEDRAILQEFTTLDMAAFIPLATIVAISWAFVYGEIRLSMNSIWPVVLMHAVEDAFLFSLIVDRHIQILPGTEFANAHSLLAQMAHEPEGLTPHTSTTISTTLG